ncbi:Hypothetical protein NTJ_13697 [Nesidiocoris tenuis]|uniref:Uncharacterized protein n=1 Tax=Nesidiocoris tenuis TaxID=355587 RepID=A0ABN7B918_9HEMI|nr:Hypothetical protein NTJ_13697 [Nesidiocoris tenuis]
MPSSERQHRHLTLHHVAVQRRQLQTTTKLLSMTTATTRAATTPPRQAKFAMPLSRLTINTTDWGSSHKSDPSTSSTTAEISATTAAMPSPWTRCTVSSSFII